ncbi:MAG TPA: hypothetical protein PKG48_02740 [Bacteroidales bacterium]|nr:hypothetical protein [Bacteroidales bacterium]HPS62532.1 hypothetical protein [Bacteroidales bacterium]
MRNLITILVFLFPVLEMHGQNQLDAKEGVVSFVTGRNVYVKFSSTDGIEPGDTLFIIAGGTRLHGLVVRELSSISCVCEPVGNLSFAVGDKLISQRALSAPAARVVPETPVVTGNPAAAGDSARKNAAVASKREPSVSGYLSATALLNFSDHSVASQRLRYTLSLNLRDIGGSKLSAETYLVFAHRPGDWEPVRSNVFNGLKIYTLALGYAFTSRSTLWLGRRINARIANAGAVDGLQYEHKAGAFTLGIFAGFRPDSYDYGFNGRLFQAGGYAGHDLQGRKGMMQTTLAFINQTNNGRTDRRFAYLQHVNSLVKNLYFFGSAEVEMYKLSLTPGDTAAKRDTTYQKSYSPTLSNLYISLRYRPIRQVSVSFTYSERQSIIYYETYRSVVEQLLYSATVRGYILNLSGQPVSPLTIGIQAAYRNGKGDVKATKNLYGYVSFSRVPGIRAAVTASATLLESGYVSGKIYSLGIHRDFAGGKVGTGVAYRFVDYKFPSTDLRLKQHVGEFTLDWCIVKKLRMGINYEGTFDIRSRYHRCYLFVSQRF